MTHEDKQFKLGMLVGFALGVACGVVGLLLLVTQ